MENNLEKHNTSFSLCLSLSKFRESEHIHIYISSQFLENRLRMEDHRTSSKFLVSLLFLLLILPIFTSEAVENEGKEPSSSSPFDFIKHLQGCHKGEKGVKGLHQLKQYLENFGYLHYYQKHLKTKNHQDDDDFDDFLESAVKTYQMNYHLNVTGSLDTNTVSMMTMPRCGVPDIVNGTNWMRKNHQEKNHHRQHRSTLIHTVSHYSFFDGNPKWPSSKTHLTYAFYSNTNPQVRRAVTKAFNQWASATHFTFSLVQNLGNADMTIGFFRGNHNDGHSFDGRGGTLAHAFAPTDGRFHFDADEPWSIGPLAGYMDVETVALHEIGHLLGLGHSSVEGAIMWPSLNSGLTKGLHADDIQGIKALYNV